MRFFVWVDFQYEMLALFVGVVLLILVYMAWTSYPKSRAAGTSEESQGRTMHGREPGHDYEKLPIAPFLIFIYIGIGIWSVSYLIYIWASKIRF